MVEVVRRSATTGDWPDRDSTDLTYLSTPGTKGRVRVGVLLLLLLLGVAVYLGFQAAAAVVDYLALRDTVRFVVTDVAMAPQRVEQRMEVGREKILTEAHALEVPLADWQVKLTADEEKVLARVRWQHPINLWGYTIFLPFEIEEVRSLR